MIKKNRIYTLFIVVFAIGFILLSGCSTNVTGGKQQNGFLGGGSSSNTKQSSSNGVVLEFVKGNPPLTIYQTQNIEFGFVFKNYLNVPVSGLQIQTKGFDRGYVSGLSQTYSVSNIPRETQVVGPGVYSGLVVNGVVVNGFQGNYNFNPEFDYCYKSSSILTQQVCVPSKTNQCNLNVNSKITNIGPEQITAKSINSINNQVRIDFEVSNKGLGVPVKTCFDTTNVYSVPYTLNQVLLGTSKGNCKAVSGFNLFSGSSNFYCVFPRSGNGAYASQISVKLSYKYQQSKILSIIAKNLNPNN